MARQAAIQTAVTKIVGWPTIVAAAAAKTEFFTSHLEFWSLPPATFHHV
jgi:hypothetical protein